jgi:hypothetical protein
VGNAAVEHRELDRLLARVVDAQDAVAYSNHRVAAMVDYTRPLLFGANVPAGVRAGLQRLVQDAAGSQVEGLVQERDRTAAVTVLRWHLAMRDARTALVAYLDARVSYLRAITTDSDTLYVEHPELDRLLERTQQAFRHAGGQRQGHRIEVAFAGGTHPG